MFSPMISKILISEYGKDENRDAMQVIFSLITRPGSEDYFTSMAVNTASVFDIESVYIAGFHQDKDQLKTFAFVQQGEVQPEFIHDSSKTPFSLILRTFKYFYTENLLQDFPEFESVFPGRNTVFLGFPLIGSLGDIVGMVCFIDHKPVRNKKGLVNLLDLISSQLTQELERKQAEDFLLLTAQAIDVLSTNLKEIHRLSISNYETLEDLYRGYLKSGTSLFQLPIGILSTINHEEYTVTAIQDTENLLPEGINISLSDTYCSLVANSGKTVFFNNASEIKEIQNTKFFREYGFSKYIGSPIYLYGEIAGTLSFYSFDSESSLIEEHLTEVIELMCKSISSEIEKRRAMEEVHRIKLQQDGDYFLTSLLIKPLAQHRVESTHFTVEFLLKQKKEFKFKNRENEIGGDICIAHSLQLRGRQHIVFLNADAMGKSLQGAGGALVMGSVFGSIIERTKIAEPYRSLYPEQWLSSVFTELQKIFESFDYSMLVSITLGVIEDDTGLLYYINAEHPSLVLYRDDTVEFIENKYQYYKLGTVPQNRLSINTFQMQPGDVIIAGSDGRDDIYLQTDETGSKKLNYDEQMFLHHVKNGKGKLNEIYSSIRNTGELSDDLSLIRVEYSNPRTHRKNRYQYDVAQIMLKYRHELNVESNYLLALAYLRVAYMMNDSNPFILQELVRLNLRYKNYLNAAYYAEKYLKVSPNSNDILSVISSSYRKAGDLESAVLYTERLHLRDPLFNKNLIRLIILYHKIGNTEKALNAYNELTEIDSNSSRHRRVKKILKRSNPDVLT